MALAGRPASGWREWLVDARDNGRRMELTWHRHERLVILSLWQGGTCRATFQLTLADAPSVIASLSSALGDAVAGAGDPDGGDRGAAPSTRRGATGRCRAVLVRARQQWQQLRARSRTRAEIVDFTTYRPR